MKTKLQIEISPQPPRVVPFAQSRIRFRESLRGWKNTSNRTTRRGTDLKSAHHHPARAEQSNGTGLEEAVANETTANETANTRQSPGDLVDSCSELREYFWQHSQWLVKPQGSEGEDEDMDADIGEKYLANGCVAAIDTLAFLSCCFSILSSLERQRMGRKGSGTHFGRVGR